jgi:predicted PurR-regulated permease PerM
VFGFAGVLLAVPMTGTIKASLDYFGELNDKTELDRIKENEEQEKMNDKKTTLPKKSKKKV